MSVQRIFEFYNCKISWLGMHSQPMMVSTACNEGREKASSKRELPESWNLQANNFRLTAYGDVPKGKMYLWSFEVFNNFDYWKSRKRLSTVFKSAYQNQAIKSVLIISFMSRAGKRWCENMLNRNIRFTARSLLHN